MIDNSKLGRPVVQSVTNSEHTGEVIKYISSISDLPAVGLAGVTYKVNNSDTTYTYNSTLGKYKGSAYVAFDALGNSTNVVSASGTPLASTSFSMVGGSAVVNSTQSGSEVILGTVAIPANSMGKNGVIRWRFKWSHTNTSTSKTIFVRLGPLGTTSDTIVMTGSSTGNAAGDMMGEIANRNNTSSQIACTNNALVLGPTSAPFFETTVNTTANLFLSFGGFVTDTATTLKLESYFVEILSRA